MPIPVPLQQALANRSGATFRTVALQVNPWDYVMRRGNPTGYGTQEEYDEALVKALVASHVDAIAITDHDRVPPDSLWHRVAEAGISVFPGFEIKTSENVHVLCVFGPDRSKEDVTAVLFALIAGEGQISQRSFIEVTRLVSERGGVVIAPHATAAGGMLSVLQGEARIKAWHDENFNAVAIPGPLEELDAGHRSILTGQEIAYRRKRGPAVLNANDIWSPTHVARAGSLSRLKMSNITIDGLRHAFLDPYSRLKLMDEPHREEHAELLAIFWEGGFLDGLAIGFSEALNVVIGGRGTGKSSLLRSIRFALGRDALTDASQEDQRTFVEQVLGPGSVVWLALRSIRPTDAEYLVRRTVDGNPIVQNVAGEVMSVHPRDLNLPIEIFGQHELSDVARDKHRHGALVTRYVDDLIGLEQAISTAAADLGRNTEQLENVEEELVAARAQLSNLGAKELQRRRYRESGLEERLGRKPVLERERRGFERAARILDDAQEQLVDFRESVDFEMRFLEELAEDPGATSHFFGDLLTQMRALKARIAVEVPDELEGLRQESQNILHGIQEQWRQDELAEINAIDADLRELGAEGADIQHFLILDREIDTLMEVNSASQRLEQRMLALLRDRQRLLGQIRESRDRRDRAFRAAAGRAISRLPNLVRATAVSGADVVEMKRRIRDHLGGRQHEADEHLDRLADLGTFDSLECAAACRAGEDSLIAMGFNPFQAGRLSGGGEGLARLIEEIDVPPLVRIELNTVRGEGDPTWRELSRLSTGQKATALLLLALAERDDDGPLIIDQPEEDLDTDFLVTGVVERLRTGKMGRQFFFATHNPNIPVLADAELVVALTATGEAGDEGAVVQIQAIGSIDDGLVRQRVADLDGGRDAFNIRRTRYGF
ncbi:MAG: AAA family ATPase [Acidimicrobiia bacterium]